jgi:hypothetical protein
MGKDAVHIYFRCISDIKYQLRVYMLSKTIGCEIVCIVIIFMI